MIVPARGPGHFGWDPIFEPLGTGLTYANFTSSYPYYWHDIEIKLCRDAFWTEEQVIASGQGTWKTGTFYRDLGLVHNPSKEKKKYSSYVSIRPENMYLRCPSTSNRRKAKHDVYIMIISSNDGDGQENRNTIPVGCKNSQHNPCKL